MAAHGVCSEAEANLIGPAWLRRIFSFGSRRAILNSESIPRLLRKISSDETLPFEGKLLAYIGLMEIYDGVMPVEESLRNLEIVFGAEFVEAIRPKAEDT